MLPTGVSGAVQAQYRASSPDSFITGQHNENEASGIPHALFVPSLATHREPDQSGVLTATGPAGIYATRNTFAAHVNSSSQAGRNLSSLIYEPSLAEYAAEYGWVPKGDTSTASLRSPNLTAQLAQRLGDIQPYSDYSFCADNDGYAGPVAVYPTTATPTGTDTMNAFCLPTNTPGEFTYASNLEQGMVRYLSVVEGLGLGTGTLGTTDGSWYGYTGGTADHFDLYLDTASLEASQDTVPGAATCPTNDQGDDLICWNEMYVADNGFVYDGSGKPTTLQTVNTDDWGWNLTSGTKPGSDNQLALLKDSIDLALGLAGLPGIDVPDLAYVALAETMLTFAYDAAASGEASSCNFPYQDNAISSNGQLSTVGECEQVNSDEYGSVHTSEKVAMAMDTWLNIPTFSNFIPTFTQDANIEVSAQPVPAADPSTIPNYFTPVTSMSIPVHPAYGMGGIVYDPTNSNPIAVATIHLIGSDGSSNVLYSYPYPATGHWHFFGKPGVTYSGTVSYGRHWSYSLGTLGSGYASGTEHDVDLRPPLVVGSLTATPSTTDVSHSTDLSLTLSGGIPSGTTYSWSNLPPGCTSQNQASITCTPTSSGTYSVAATVTASGSSSTRTTTLVVNMPPSVSSAILCADSYRTDTSTIGTTTCPGLISNGVMLLDASQWMSAHAEVSDGTDPFTYVWSVASGNVPSTWLSSSCVGTNTNYVDCQATSNIGDHACLTLTATDAIGATTTWSSGSPAVSCWKVNVGQLSWGATYSPSSGSAPLPVQFSETASGGTGSYGWSWSFGDYNDYPSGGGTSSAQSPTNTYKGGGNFFPTMTMSDSNFNGGMVFLPVLTVSGGFQLTINANPELSPQPDPVKFSTSGAPSGASFSWTFGDGGTSTAATPSHTYDSCDKQLCAYTVDATVRGGGVTETASTTVGVGFINLNCIAYGTPILTPSGYVDVQNLSAGDTIIGYNTMTGVRVNESLTSVDQSMVQNMTVINDGLLVVTPTGQPLYIHNGSFTGWLQEARDLTTADSLWNPVTNSWIPVTSVKISTTNTLAYDVQVTGERDFVANGVLVLDKIALAFTCSQICISVTPPSAVGVIDNPVDFVGKVDKGTANYIYNWSYGDGSYNQFTTDNNNTSASHSYAQPGTYTLSLKVTDSNGYTAKTSATVNIYPPNEPVIYSYLVEPPQLDLGQQVTFNVTAAFGSGNFTYVWEGLPSGCLSTNAPVITCTPSTEGTYAVSVEVNDTTYGTTATSETVQVSVFPDPVVQQFIADPGSGQVETGQDVAFYVAVQGGTGSYSYQWTGLPTGCAASDSPKIDCTLTGPGTYNVQVVVADTARYNVSSSLLSYVVLTNATVANLSASPISGSIDAGQQRQATFSTTVTGGVPPYTFFWTGLPAGCLSTNTSTLTCTPTTAGYYLVQAWVIDNYGLVQSSAVLPYEIDSDPFVAAPHPSTTSIDLGQEVAFSTYANEGSDNYTYAWSGLPSGCSTVNSNLLNCTPSSSGTYTLSTFVTDSNGYTRHSGNLTFIVYPDPTLSTPSANRATVDVGQNVVFTVQVNGGSGNFTDRWFWDGLGCTNSTTNTISCVPLNSGLHSIYVAVTDSNGVSATSPTLNYTAYTDPTITAPTASPPTVFQGSPTTFTSSTSGGSGNDTYTWNGLPPGCSSVTTLSLACTPSGYGIFNVTITVTDSNGFSVTSGALGFTVYSTHAYYLQEAASLAQFGQGVTGFYAWYFGLTLATSPYPTLYGFNGLTNTGDSYEIAVGYNWPNCNAGFETLYTWGNTAGSTVGTVCDPTAVLHTGDSVALDLSVSSSGSTSGDVCMDLYDPASAITPSAVNCVAQPDGGPYPANNWFVPSSTTLNPNGYFTGPETEAISNSACPAFSSMPTVAYQWASGIQPTEFYAWSQEFQAGGATCSSSVSPLFNPASNYYSTIYTEAAPSLGPHWLAAQDISNVNNDYWWQFTTDATPASPASSSIIASQAAADVGQTVTYTPTVTGGTSPYTCSWYLNGAYQVQSCSGVTFTPTSPGTYAIVEYTQDASGNTYGPSNTITTVVSSDPAITQPTASRSSADVGQTVTFTVTTSGGSGGNTVVWIGLPTGCSSANSLTVTCSPTASGTFSVKAKITDSNGYTVTSTALSYRVYGTLGVTYTATEYYWDGYEWVYDFQASCGGTLYSYQNYDEMIEFTATTTGGAPISSYTWNSASPAWFWENNNWNYETSPVSGGSVADFAYDSTYAGGTITPRVTVTDANGESASYGCSFYVA